MPSVMALIKDTKAAQEVTYDKDVNCAFCYRISCICNIVWPVQEFPFSILISSDYQFLMFLSGPSSEGVLRYAFKC